MKKDNQPLVVDSEILFFSLPLSLPTPQRRERVLLALQRICQCLRKLENNWESNETIIRRVKWIQLLNVAFSFLFHLYYLHSSLRGKLLLETFFFILTTSQEKICLEGNNCKVYTQDINRKAAISFKEFYRRRGKRKERKRTLQKNTFPVICFCYNQLNKHFAQIMVSNILACYLTDFIMKLIS